MNGLLKLASADNGVAARDPAHPGGEEDDLIEDLSLDFSLTETSRTGDSGPGDAFVVSDLVGGGVHCE